MQSDHENRVPTTLTACASRNAVNSRSCSGQGSLKRRDGVVVLVLLQVSMSLS